MAFSFTFVFQSEQEVMVVDKALETHSKMLGKIQDAEGRKVAAAVGAESYLINVVSQRMQEQFTAHQAATAPKPADKVGKGKKADKTPPAPPAAANDKGKEKKS